jgi:RNA polymerase sigma factor (sigma-70 family)
MDWQERANATEQLLKQRFLAALGGDEAAYQQFLTSLAKHLRGFFRRRLTQLPEEVEDLVQECLIAVHQSRHTYDLDQPLTAWLHTIARYKLVDRLRARSRREALHDPIDEDGAELFAREETEAVDARRDLEKILENLPERQRRVLLMMKVDGASVAEVSAATGMSESAVKVSVHRSLKMLAAKIRSPA